MKVKTINYQKVFPLGMYVNERIGVEVEVEEGENEDEVFEMTKKMVHWWADQKSQLHDASEPDWLKYHNLQVTTQPSAPEERVVGDIAGDMRSCTDMRVLETYRFLIKGKPELESVYQEMKDKLSNPPHNEKEK